MSPYTADIVRLPRYPACWSRWHRLQQLARHTDALVSLTPDAPAFSQYDETDGPGSNCYAYANGCRVSWPHGDVRRPGGGAAINGPAALQRALSRDGWIPGVPERPTGGVYIVAAFWRPEDQANWSDYHFVRLGPDGWSHKTGQLASTAVADPFEAAARADGPYRAFCGWWTVPISARHNQVRRRFHAAEASYSAYVASVRGTVTDETQTTEPPFD